MRSRVTWKDWPTSSSVCSEPSSRPKRILMTRSSRGVSVRRTCDVYSFRLTEMTASDGRDGHAVFDEVAEVRIFLFADGGLERDGLLRDLEDLADLRDGDVHAPGDLFGGGFAAELLHQLAARCG